MRNTTPSSPPYFKTSTYVYTITINLTSSEYFDYTEVEEVSLTTNIGTRIAKDTFGINWRIPVMIFVIFVGASLTLTGIAIMISSKAQKNAANKARNELAKSNPEINTRNMTDEEILAKQREIKFKNMQENDNELASLFGVERKPKEKVCEYCGATNSSDAKKCSSCGANLGTKK